MAHYVTTSVRLSSKLRKRLNEVALLLHQNADWIIVHALEVYLKQPNSMLFANEARRQSLLISEKDDHKEMDLWEKNIDTTGWK